MTRRAHTSRCRSTSSRTGSVIVVVVWTVAVAALITAALQLNAYREATLGREALSRVQARWAARAGVERMISILAYHTVNPVSDDAFALTRELEDWSYDMFSNGAKYDVIHTVNGVAWAGPQDEHAKPNVNLLDFGRLLNLPDMSYDSADAILDWIDGDNDVRTQGAEAEFYGNRGYKYRPRNGPIRSIAELELIASCWPEFVRSEDWNLNGRLDENENDGDLSWPPDNHDGFLDAGWSGYLTAYSRSGQIGGSGIQKLQVQGASNEEIIARTGVTEQQAAALKQYSGAPNARLENLLVTDLGTLAQTSGGSSGGGSSGGGGGGGSRGGSSGGVKYSGGVGGASGGSAGGGSSGGGSSGGATGGGSSHGGSGGGSSKSNSKSKNASATTNLALSTEQLKSVFRELTFEDPNVHGPGKVNVNTVSAEVLREVLSFDSKLADNIVAARDDRPEGFTSIVDLLDVAGMDPAILSGIASMLDTTSNVFSISARGTAPNGGLSVEIFVVVDRSTLPIRILEYREQ